MPTEHTQEFIILWLNRALHDERGRAFLRAQLERNELPVIDLGSRQIREHARPQKNRPVKWPTF